MFVFSNIGGVGKIQGGLLTPGRYGTASLGKGLKRQRHKDYGRRYLGMCQVAEPEGHSASITGSCATPLSPAGSFREHFLRYPLCTGYQPFLE